MPAYNFLARFARAVETGQKTQTIRPDGKRRHVAVGEKIQLYTGMRSKACRKLIDPDPVCTDVLCLEIERLGRRRVRLRFTGQGALDMRAKGIDSMSIAQSDGFKDPLELVEWIEQAYGLPFSGVLIKWHAPATANAQHPQP